MTRNHIDFNRPYLTGKETHYIYEAVSSGKISGNGIFTKKCQQFFESKFGFKKTLLTTSCTDALEMAAILTDIQPGDEVILPSYTFVSTANAFVLRGAKLIFADSNSDEPNLNADLIESLITSKTKVIVPVHYAGVSCDMNKIMEVANKHNIFVVEDAAQAVDSYFNDRPLGGIGHLSAFSFHETKNIISGEGGMLAINDERFIERAEIIWEKGTNRSAFFRGEVDKYGWVDVGSSFLPSEVVSAFLYAQIENIEDIQNRRKEIWNIYRKGLTDLNGQKFQLPIIPEYGTNNAHMFYIVCKTPQIRKDLLAWLRSKDIHAVFHYLSLHKSPFYQDKHDGRDLPNSDRFTENLVRLPLFYDLKNEEVEYIISEIRAFVAE